MRGDYGPYSFVESEAEFVKNSQSDEKKRIIKICGPGWVRTSDQAVGLLIFKNYIKFWLLGVFHFL